ncbi:MAG: tryptophan synthase subunit alpha [Gemmatimonadota bacterium]
MTTEHSPEPIPTTERIAEAFQKRKAKGQAALVPYICAGYPTAEDSLELMRAAADAGADLIELGIPFSDPLADGPTIQKASFRAIESGMTIAKTFEILRCFREEWDTPVVLFTYLNPVHHFGMDRFVAEARKNGADGLLLTDLPAGNDPEMEAAVASGGLALIRLVAPTTPAERIPRILEGASGFVYYISRTGVTGARAELREELGREIEALRSRIPLPLAVGFGISSPEQARLVAGFADGVVVGSALVDRVEKGGVAAGGAFLRELRRHMDR